MDSTESKTHSALQVAGIPLDTSNEALEEIFSEYGPLKRCFVVNPKLAGAKKTFGIVEFAFSDDALKAFNSKGGAVSLGDNECKLKLVPGRLPKKLRNSEKTENETQATKTLEEIRENVTYAKKKRARLIIRNLSFKADDEKLKQHFEQCGKVEDVNILKKPDGKMVGCAFVQFSNISEAAKAIKTLNGKPFLNRPVAVDWAVSKKDYNATVSNEAKIEVEEIKDEEMSGGDEENQDSDEDEQDDNLDEDEELIKEENSDEELSSKKSEKKQKWAPGHDVSENRTVFVRNLNFDSDQEDLRDLMEENFGKVLFALMVIDKMTERPKGTAFVKFGSTESAEKCVKASETEGIFLDGRQIYCTMALSKADADEKQIEKKKKEPKDSRNLYLAREGLIREGTLAAQGVSKADLEKRVQLEKYKRNVLKNLNMFVSPTRLCFRNIPPHIDDKKLLTIVKKFSQNPSAKITECRIMKDLKNGGFSKGYAFLTFATHEGALNALRKLNNNPKVFTRDARPIIEFSIENRAALKARQKRLEKSIEKNPQIGSAKNSPAETQSDVQQAKAGTKIYEKEAFTGAVSDPSVKKLPSHVGPKIRHKKPKITRKSLAKQEKAKNNPKKNRKRPAADSQPAPSAEPASKKLKPAPKSDKKLKKKMAEQAEEKKFNTLVQNYKSRLLKTVNVHQKSKWFE